MTFIKDWFNKGNKSVDTTNDPRDGPKHKQEGKAFPDLKPGGIVTMDAEDMERRMFAESMRQRIEGEERRKEFERHMQQTAQANAARAAGMTGATTGTVPKNDLPTVEELDHLIKTAPLPRWQAVVMAGALLEGQAIDEAVATAEAAVHSYSAEQRVTFDRITGKDLLKHYYEEKQRKMMEAMKSMSSTQVHQMKAEADRMMAELREKEMAKAYGMGTIRADKLYGRSIV